MTDILSSEESCGSTFTRIPDDKWIKLTLVELNKLSLCHYRHKKRRAWIKKIRRKRKRQRLACIRDKEEHNDLMRRQASPSYTEQQKRAADLEEEEERKQHLEAEQVWLAREAEAQLAWQESQKRLQLQREKEAVQSSSPPQPPSPQSVVDQQEPSTYTIPLAPMVITRPLSVMQARQPSPSSDHRPVCTFFHKTGACRYGMCCSRRHDIISSWSSSHDGAEQQTRIDDNRVVERAADQPCFVLLITAMFVHSQLNGPEVVRRWRYGSDQDMEEEETEDATHDPPNFARTTTCNDLVTDLDSLTRDYADFYWDVAGELESRWGRIKVMRTCLNRASHLQGSVYVEFTGGLSAAQDAALGCQGRWFAGRQLECRIVHLKSGWSQAICGLHHRGRCPKGDAYCNFLHVILNPGESVDDLLAFLDHDRRVNRSRSPSRRRRRSSQSRYSRSPSPDRVRRHSMRSTSSTSGDDGDFFLHYHNRSPRRHRRTNYSPIHRRHSPSPPSHSGEYQRRQRDDHKRHKKSSHKRRHSSSKRDAQSKKHRHKRKHKRSDKD